MFYKTREPDTHYQILKVKTTATSKDIKMAYYKMAKMHHPDFASATMTEKQKQEAEDYFKVVVKSYEVLSNPIAR